MMAVDYRIWSDANGDEPADYIAAHPDRYELLISPTDQDTVQEALLSGAVVGCTVYWSHPDEHARVWAYNSDTALAAYDTLRAVGITIHPKDQA